MSVLSRKVSQYINGFDTNPITVDLWDWLESQTETPELKAIRAEHDEAKRGVLKLKSPFPCTVSGVFNDIRDKAHLKEHSGLICVDIDFKRNTHIQNFPELKEIISTAPFVAYSSVSASGEGLYFIIPIAFPERHLEQFRALESMFAKMGIVIDPVCKDVTRLRTKSYDPNPYVNHKARPFKIFLSTSNRIKESRHEQEPEMAKIWVETAIEEICFREIDLTDTYEKWLNIGFAFAAQFDEDGRDYFHQVSQFHPYYSYEGCDQQYDRCLNRDHTGGVTIATFYNLCAKADIRIKDLLAAADFK